MYTIKCGSMTEFYDAIAACIQRGLTFEADHASLIIKLTGGY